MSTHRKSAWLAAGLFVTLSLLVATSAAYAQQAPAAPKAPGVTRSHPQPSDSSADAKSSAADPSKPETARDKEKRVPKTAKDTPPKR
jgi:hypothetical protein